MTRFPTFVALALLLAAPVSAQFGSGIQGTILDPSSAVVPDTKVLVVNLSTGVTREAISSAEGI